MKKIELLAPAGDMSSLKAAVMAGADAIYLGGKSFGARAYSSNFSDEEIINAITYCHLYGVKVYVTCNTLIYDNEVEKFLSYVSFLHQNNVDALLIQDLGMLDLVHQTFPNLELHASTQMHIHNEEGVKFILDQGVKRIVLARETPLSLVKSIKEKTDAEIEIFVHGSLCLSYSGQCLMSYFIGGRSGNRGACAGSCRLPYEVIYNDRTLNPNNHYPLSTKDLCTLESLALLIESGADSLKIEGRMKGPEYVYTVTKLYREAIDSYYATKMVTLNDELFRNLKRLFHRDYTKGYLLATSNESFVDMNRPNNQGTLIGEVTYYNHGYMYVKLAGNLNYGDGLRIVGDGEYGLKVNDFYLNHQVTKHAKANDFITIPFKERISEGALIYLTYDHDLSLSINELIASNPRKVTISATLNAQINKPLSLSLSDGLNEVIVSGPIIETAKNQPTSKETVLSKLNKINDTVYTYSNLSLNLDDNIFIPLTNLNELRREAFTLLDEKRLPVSNYVKKEYFCYVPDFPSSKLKTCLVPVSKFTPDLLSQYDVVYSPDNIPNTILQLPRVNYTYPEITNHVLVGEIGSLYKYHDVDTDFSLNVTNSYTVAFLHALGVKKITLSYELSYDQINYLINAYQERYHHHPNLEVIIKSRPEVMVSPFSLQSYFHKQPLSLKDRFGNLYPIIEKNNLMTIYNYQIIDLTKYNYYQIGVNYTRYNL